MGPGLWGARLAVAIAAIASAPAAWAAPASVARAATPTTAPASQELSDPDAPSIAARVPPGQYYIGDQFPLVVTAIGRAGIQVHLPARLELQPFDVIDVQQSSEPTGDGRMEYQFTLTISAYDTGKLSIPPVPITYLSLTGDARTVSTQPIALEIRSLLANEPSPQLKESLPPIAVYQRNWTLVIVGAVLFGIAVVAAGTVLVAAALRRRAARAVPPAPPRPAIDVALEKLQALVQAGDFSRDDYKPFYFTLSEIVREYLGHRYGFESLELTTTELVDELVARCAEPPPDGSPKAHLDQIQGWLASTDLVKFAKYLPTDSEARTRLAEATALLEATRPTETSAPTEPAEEAQRAHG
jgi:hypothetical protein